MPRPGPALALLALLLVAACSDRYMTKAEKGLEPTTGKAVVRFLRPGEFYTTVNVLDGEKAIGNIYAFSQFDYLADPGHHLFVIAWRSAEFLEADLEAGKTYYVVVSSREEPSGRRVPLYGVRRDARNWDQVLAWERELTRYAPNPEQLDRWQSANSGRIGSIIWKYEHQLKDRHDWPRLSPEDGR